MSAKLACRKPFASESGCVVQDFFLSRRWRTCTSSCLIFLRLAFRPSISLSFWESIVGVLSVRFRISSCLIRAVTCSESSLINTLYLSGRRERLDHNSLSEISDVSLRRTGVAREAGQLMLFHGVPGALHVNLFLRCKLGADLIERCRTGFAVFPKPEFKSLFEIRTL
jgi:hypothetical protein